jgi:hypothetical protein
MSGWMGKSDVKTKRTTGSDVTAWKREGKFILLMKQWRRVNFAVFI